MPEASWREAAAGISCGMLALAGNLCTDRLLRSNVFAAGISRRFFLLLGDERCSAEVAPSIALACGTGIGVAYTPSPLVCGVLSTLLVSLLPLAVIPLLPKPKPGETVSSAQPLLLCFACGGLLGDVFLHILPHTLGGHHGHDDHDHHGGGHDHHDHGHDDHHDHHEHHDHHDAIVNATAGESHAHSLDEAMGGLAVLLGFAVFFVVEKLIRSQHGGGHGHSHGHSHGHNELVHDEHAHAHDEHGACCEEEHDGGHEHAHAHEHGHSEGGGTGLRKRRAASPKKPSPSAKRTAASPKRKASPKKATPTPKKAASAKATAAAAETAVALAAAKGASESRVAGYLNLAADAAHNFTDGLLIGGAYSQGFYLGVSSTIACIMHEVPHEVGDVAILMQAGFSLGAATRAQLLTAISAMIGTIVAVLSGEQQAGLLLNFTAGGFIYVATVDVLPSLLQQPSSALQTAKEVGAFFAGVGMMLLVMVFEAGH